jgi:hypothetical protein
MRAAKLITIPGKRTDRPGERDNGKKFLITEMSARQGEKWANRAFLALASSAVSVPGMSKEELDELAKQGGGLAEIARIAALVGHIQFPELDPLLDELMGCVAFVTDDKRSPPLTRPIMDVGMEGDDIEEIATRHLLRSEVVKLHIGFFIPGEILNLIALASTMTASQEDSNDTSTSLLQ